MVGLSVNTINHYAFESCKSLKSVVIPDSVKTIGFGAFASCTSLESVVIHDSVISIQKDVFSDCPSLKIITIDGQTTEYLEKYFETNYPKIELEYNDYLLK